MCASGPCGRFLAALDFPGKSCNQGPAPRPDELASNLHQRGPPTLMLSKVCAFWLVVLVLLPLTPPFSMFDLTGLLSVRTCNLGTPSSKTPSAVLTQAALSRAMPFPPSPASRVRPTLTRARLPHANGLAPVAAAAPSCVTPIQVVHPPRRSTVLRI